MISDDKNTVRFISDMIAAKAWHSRPTSQGQETIETAFWWFEWNA